MRLPDVVSLAVHLRQSFDFAMASAYLTENKMFVDLFQSEQ